MHTLLSKIGSHQYSGSSKHFAANYGQLRWLNWTQFWQFVLYVICQIMAREMLQLTSWNLATEKYTDAGAHPNWWNILIDR